MRFAKWPGFLYHCNFARFVVPLHQGFTGLSQPSPVICAPLPWHIPGYQHTPQATRLTPIHILYCTHCSWLILLQVKSSEEGSCNVTIILGVTQLSFSHSVFLWYLQSDSVGRRTNPENLLLHKLFYFVLRKGQSFQSLNGGFMPEEAQNWRLQVLFCLTHHSQLPQIWEAAQKVVRKTK